MWAYYNLFQPVLRMQAKTLVQRPGERPHLQRTYDIAHTPLDRLCATNVLPQQQQDALLHWRNGINPRRAHQDIHALLDYIMVLPAATKIQDVHAAVAALDQPVPWPVAALTLQGTG
jgi:hypothetical protein